MKLYYGNGSCTIEGSARGVEIRYRGAIVIEDKTSDSFVIAHQNNGILIFPIGEGTLKELFDYVGEFKITSFIAINNNAEKVSTTIHRVMDYTELLNTNSEDMTINSEDLSSTYVYGKKVAKTILKKPHVNDLNTSDNNAELYFKNGDKYDGYFHIHLADNAVMTGSEHTEESQDLYLSTGKPTRNTGVPYGAIEQKKQRRIQARKVQTKRLRKRLSNNRRI